MGRLNLIPWGEITCKLWWSDHITSAAAMQGKSHSQPLEKVRVWKEAKKRAYVALVCPHLEYSLPVWNPCLKDCNKFEKVQKPAACLSYCRWVTHTPGQIHMKRLANTSNLKCRRNILS